MAKTTRDRLTYLRRRALARWLYRRPLSQLSPERLYLWSQALIETADVPGAVVEIGCASGGTSAHCDRLLRNIGVSKPYVAIDTFDGFVPEQFDHDAERGTPEAVRHGFAASSQILVRQILKQLGAPDVELVQADIVTMAPQSLPSPISAVLVDVDLSQPVYAALRKVWPLMAPGGMVLVDDCDLRTGFRARDGFQRFCAEFALAEDYTYGMGVLRREPAQTSTAHASA
ncbi:class I SAM-dependent methyltransferase [Actinomadura sp. DC4]|uniref:class I SAM-dependent methyltransferase n=1 Tax=Actinomadura sp. DC4 TaxID=3055069 RepID=UPI0025B213DF|nr:class I SAM-dependent methyltransferase [Actinomadura sp. DC4]MDN3358949.1 class I SAM-dependent methyltransferase [Actinomadura sp. DC4]